jgi:hypothetical protein
MGGSYFGMGLLGDTLIPGMLLGDSTHYGYTFTDANGCLDSASGLIIRDSVPRVSIDTIVPLCIGSDTLILSQGLPMGGIYSGPIVRNDSVIDPSLAAGGGLYLIRYKYVDLYGCADSATRNVLIDTVIKIKGLEFDSACANADTLILKGGNPAGGIYRGKGVVGDSLFYAPAVDSSNSVITYFYSSYCGVDSLAAQIKILEPPTVSLGAISKLCENDAPVSPNTGNPAGGIYEVNGVVSTIIDPMALPGTSTLKYTFTDNKGCTSVASQNLVVNPMPKFSISGKTELCLKDTLVLKVNAEAGSTYRWNGDSTGAVFEILPEELNQGLSYINVEVTDADNCRKEEAVLVWVSPCMKRFELYPNPNNGQFNVYLHLLKNAEVNISVVSSLGQILLQEKQLGKSGLNEFLVHFLAEGAGVYFIRLEVEGERFMEKFVVD